MRNFVCLFLFLSLLLGGCQPAATPAATTEKRLTLEPCKVAGNIPAECGYLYVPEDRNNPNSRILKLWTVVIRAYGPDPQPDPLFYIVGGPGVYVTGASIVDNARNILFRKVNARHDLVFLDQRGTNDQHRLTCELPPSGIGDATSRQQVDDWMEQCLAGLEGDPRFYTTAPAMQDLDDARDALGYDKINLYGISYGAAAAQVYMRMFPEHVRAVVLDHGTALDLPFRYVLPRASQTALDQVFAYCGQDEQCHSAFPDIRGDFKKVLDRLAKGPVTTSYTRPGMDTPATITLEGLADGLHELMYNGIYGQIPLLIHTLAANEDWTAVAKSYDQQYGTSSSEDNQVLLMQYMIFCFEPAWGTQPDQLVRFSPDSYYLTQEAEILQSQQKICEALPKPDPSLIYGPGKPTPLSVLILNSLLDPQNPPSNMDLTLKEFTKSRVVVEPTEGHEPNLNSDHYECRLDIMAQYIEQGSVDKLDTSCLKEIKPSFVTGDD